MTLQNVFLHLLNMSITAGWLVLAVVVLRLVFRRAPKWIHCLLWVLVALRLLFPVSIESALSIIPSAETVPVETFMYDTPVINSGVSAVDNAVNPVLSDNFAPQPQNSANPMQVLTGLAAYAWVLGAALMLLYAAITTLRLRLRVRESVRLRDNIYRCDRIWTPFILGVIRPRIYLPTTLSTTDTHSVVAHETAHIQRRDHWWKPLGFLLLTVYWFNPLLWVGYVLLCRDIEAACDEKVIRDMDLTQRKSYSDTLLACSAPRHLITACPLAFGETGVKSRIKAVLSYKKPAFWLIIAAVVATVVASVCLLTNPASDAELDSILTQIILEEHQSEHTGDAYPTEAHTILGTRKKDGKTIVYSMVLYEEYYQDENGELQVQSGSHIPTVITVDMEGNGYSLVEYWTPRDGTDYSTDIREKFPVWHWWQTDTQRHIDKHQQKTLADAKAHFGAKTFRAASTAFSFGSNFVWESNGAYSTNDLPVLVIRSVSDLEAFITQREHEGGITIESVGGYAALELRTAYSEEYFQNKAVLAVFYQSGTCSDSPRVIGIDYSDGLQVLLDVYTPYMGDDALGYWCKMVNVTQEELDMASSVTARVRGYIPSNVYAAAFKQETKTPAKAQELWRDFLKYEEEIYLYAMMDRLAWGEKSMEADSGTYIGAFNITGITAYVSSDYTFICTEEEMAHLTAEDGEFFRKLYQSRDSVKYATPYYADDSSSVSTKKEETQENVWQTLGHPMVYNEASAVSGGRSLTKANKKVLQDLLDEVTWHSDAAPGDSLMFDAYFSLDDATRYYVSLDTWGTSGCLYNGKEYADLTEKQASALDFMLPDGGSTIKPTHTFYGYFAEWNKNERCYVLDVVQADDASLVGKKIRVNTQNLYGSGLPYLGALLKASYDGTVLGDTVYAQNLAAPAEEELPNAIAQSGTITGKVIYVLDDAVLLNCYNKEQFDVVWVRYKASSQLTPQMNDEYQVVFNGQAMETYPPQITAQTMTQVSSTPLNNGFISEDKAIEIAIARWNVNLDEPDMMNGYYATVYVMESPTAENPHYKLGYRQVDTFGDEPRNSALFYTMEINAVTGEVLADSYMP